MSEIEKQSAEISDAPEELVDDDLAKVSGGFTLDWGEPNLSSAGQDLEQKMAALLEKTNPEKRLELLFQMGQQSTRPELIGVIVKSLQDTLKSMSES